MRTIPVVGGASDVVMTEDMSFVLQAAPNMRNPQYLTIAFNRKGVELLRSILAKATNTWDAAPAEVKELHDMVVHGQLLQEYAR